MSSIHFPIFPYLGGEDLNNDPRQQPSRYIIDFEDMSEASAREGWPDLIAILEEKVKPQRARDQRQALRERWWRFGDRQPGLYNAIKSLPSVIGMCRVTKHLSFALLPRGM